MTSLLCLSGSLRAASVNTALLRIMARLAPPGVAFSLHEGLGALPLYNPDLDGREAPSVHAFRQALQAADAIVIASPEYAHGVTGVIKNALDWVVGSGEFTDKPVALLVASSRSLHAPEALRKTLAVMGARVIEQASVLVPVNNSRAGEEEIAAMPEVVAALRQVTRTLAQA